jgi:acyl-CoA thioester hydrolase
MTAALPDLTDQAIFYSWSENTIRFGDMDSTGHVNNVAFAGYVEDGRVPFMKSGLLPAYDDKQRFVVGNLSIRFRQQAWYPGSVRIGTGVLAIGRTSLTLGHGVFSGDACLVTAETVMVYIVGAKASPITDDMRENLKPAMLTIS